MIIVQLAGGTGNQMFQYAAGRALAERVQAPLRVDVGAFATRSPAVTPRHYALSPFSAAPGIATPSELRVFRLRARLGLASQLVERGRFYDPAFEQAGKYTYLIGHWHTERYFASLAPLIRQAFTVRQPPNPRSAALLEKICRPGTVSVHVRRGDYITNTVAAMHHGVLSLEYYARAAALMLEKIPQPHFYVFSDEPHWAKEALRLPGPMSVIDLHGPDEGHEDLRLMRACHHHIIANSSFSWWGAWLSEYQDKIVIAPRQWFRSAEVDTHDFCPAEWIRL